ncbi:hypothetical protein [Pelagovum pacificum]|uniref:Uncharacterized protein n=1 Tax=Pelagovum pacificum TaxID=2588711 RepID=A0A5C5GEA1_9RHOB|nr:hypothetical protein [Pelagovum pacificum]TNY33105.1 hypothetical protein FHY64_07445 [Pelagovum pacificum]
MGFSTHPSGRIILIHGASSAGKSTLAGGVLFLLRVGTDRLLVAMRSLRLLRGMRANPPVAVRCV